MATAKKAAKRAAKSTRSKPKPAARRKKPAAAGAGVSANKAKQPSRTPPPVRTKPSSGRGRAGIAEIRRVCLALPETSEQETWGDPTFRVGKRIFAMHKVGDGRQSVWCKASFGTQQALVDANPEVFFVPPYVGHHGWIGVRLDRETPWQEVTSLLQDAYRLTAPKKLVARLEI